MRVLTNVWLIVIVASLHLTNKVQIIQVRPDTTMLTAVVSCTKKVSFYPLISAVQTCMVTHCIRDDPASFGAAAIFHVVDSSLQNDSHSIKEQSLTEDTRGDNHCNPSESSNCESWREMERRRKIGLANKGRVPWNKGRKHSEETREIIRQRTKEAMGDLKVRKKLSEFPRSLSNQTKARISMSLQKLWERRLNWKRSREKIFQLWADSIARAAKTGGSDQQELEWDSFEKIKREMHLQQLEWTAQRAKEKEMRRLRAERAAKKREKRKSVGGTKRKTRKKSKEDDQEPAGNQEFNLKRKLMKIRKQKSSVSCVRNQQQRTWENLNMKFNQTEENQVTLADQIQLAKLKRAE